MKDLKAKHAGPIALCFLVLLVGAPAIIDSMIDYTCPLEWPTLTQYRQDELRWKPENWESEMKYNYECDRQYKCLLMSDVEAAEKRAEVTGL